MMAKLRGIFLLTLTACSSPEQSQTSSEVTSQPTDCSVTLTVLGVAQDGGKPQAGNVNDPAWADPTLKRLATSLAIIDHRADTPQKWLFEATPDIKEQLNRLNKLGPTPNDKFTLDGIFLTHAHIGHYAGLMMLGHEALSAQNITTYAMPKMATFLSGNGPWSQLVRYNNITLAIMEDGIKETLTDNLTVTPFLVPHRQEFSEVVGYRIDGPTKSALFIPDIDSWEDWDERNVKIEDFIRSVDIAFLDATFFADGEIPGRDMSGFPHPFVSHSMARFAPLPATEKAKVRFIHMNHTNPLHDPNASEREIVKAAGFNIAEEGEEVCL